MPHNPKVNGLKYLYHYSPKQASMMMTSSNWTRALMVRDPKVRFLSAFLDKALGDSHKHIKRKCCKDSSCIQGALTLKGFLDLCKVCDDSHWRRQHERIDSKFWPYIDTILHTETAFTDAKALLEKIGAWEDYGATGWGEDGKYSIFQSKGKDGAGNHATWAQSKIFKWYTPESERLVERFYQTDYENPLFNFTRDECLTCIN